MGRDQPTGIQCAAPSDDADDTEDPLECGDGLRISAWHLGGSLCQDLDVLNRVHSQFASVSPQACAQLWTGGDRKSHAEVIRALSKLTDAEVLQWVRVSTNATILGLEAPANPSEVHEDALMPGLEAIAEAIEPADAERY